MSSKKKLSGSERLKRRAFEKAKEHTQDIQSVFNIVAKRSRTNIPSDKNENVSIQSEGKSMEMETSDCAETNEIVKDATPSTSTSDQHTSSHNSLSSTLLSHSNLISIEVNSPVTIETPIVDKDIENELEYYPIINEDIEYPTDPALFKDVVLSPTVIEKLLNLGPCQPGVHDDLYNYPKSDTRWFQNKWYFKTVRHKKQHRVWLIYSYRLNKCFCFSCWLFGDMKNQYPTWCNIEHGFHNFKKGVEKIEAHENSSMHLNSIKAMYMTQYRLKSQTTIRDQINLEQENEVMRNRRLVTIFLDCVLFLCNQSLPLRGHIEHGGKGDNSINEGNYLELIKFISRYNPEVANHLKHSKRNETYLSPRIQNDFIAALGEEVLKNIIKDITEAQFYAVIVDSTIDISRIDQFSLSIRYICPKSLVPKERFIMFDKLPACGAETYFNLLMTNIKKIGLVIENCRGQAYDGASNMSGDISGLQRRVKEICPNALYIHCSAHKLNLVLSDAASSSTVATHFFGTIESIYVFINSSLPRLHILEEEQDTRTMVTDIKKFLTLKRLSETRWYSRLASVRSIKQNVKPIFNTVLRIINGEIKLSPTAASQVAGISANINTFEFYLLLVFWEKVLEAINTLSKYLQVEDMDFATAKQLFKVCQETLGDMRSEEEFNKVEEEARILSNSCSIDNKYQIKRIRTKKTFHDETTEYSEINDSTDSRTKFVIEVYYVILDTLNLQLAERFKDFNETACLFRALNTTNFIKTNVPTSDDLSSIKQLYSIYKSDLEDEDEENLKDEYVSFRKFYYNLFSVDKANMVKTRDILVFIISNKFETIYKNLCVLYKIYLTLPISSASAERSFSRLKIIKSYLRSTINEERLSNMAIISIEKDVAKSLNLSTVVDKFAEMKLRRKKL